jgi:hypothetical protein
MSIGDSHLPFDAARAAAQSSALASHRLLDAIHGIADRAGRVVDGVSLPIFVARRLDELAANSHAWQQAVLAMESRLVPSTPRAAIAGMAGETYHAAAVYLARFIAEGAWNAAVSAHFRAPKDFPEPCPPVNWLSYWVPVWETLRQIPPFDLNAVFAEINREAILSMPFVGTPLQMEIYKALDGRALKKLALAIDVCGGDGNRLYRPGGIKEMMAKGVVVNTPGVGYYRPDAPPRGLVISPAESG